MKILLVQSCMGKDTPLVYPVGLAYIASGLDGHETRLLDLNLCDEPYEELEKTLKEFQPEVVGLSLRNIDNHNRIYPTYHYLEFRKTVAAIRKMAPHVRIMAGGSGFSMYARKIMERNPAIDFGIYLEGEESLPELLARADRPESVVGIYYRKNDIVVFSGERSKPDFAIARAPRRDLVDMARYPEGMRSIGIQSKRGCPLDCSYCNYPFLNGSKIRVRLPAGVVDEIESMKNEHGVDEFIFVDSVFNVPCEHAEQICEEIIGRNLAVRWAAYFDIRYADEALLLKAAEAGCEHFIFSPDAVSAGALKALRKGISKEDIEKTARIFERNPKLRSAYMSFGFFLNPPGETLGGLLDTLLFCLKLRWTLRPRCNAFVHWIRIEPYTELHRKAVDSGVIREDTDLLPDGAKGLDRLFYSRPPLNRLDPLLKTLHRSRWRPRPERRDLSVYSPTKRPPG
jgi:radical SAM superfamily enzyme YgiQ (UPF0313 family)